MYKRSNNYKIHDEVQHFDEISFIEISDQYELVVTSSYKEGTIKIWELGSGKCLRTIFLEFLKGFLATDISIRVNFGQGVIIVMYLNKSYIYDLSMGIELYKITINSRDTIRGITLDNEMKMLICVNSNWEIQYMPILQIQSRELESQTIRIKTESKNKNVLLKAYFGGTKYLALFDDKYTFSFIPNVFKAIKNKVKIINKYSTNLNLIRKPFDIIFFMSLSSWYLLISDRRRIFINIIPTLDSKTVWTTWVSELYNNPILIFFPSITHLNMNFSNKTLIIKKSVDSKVSIYKIIEDPHSKTITTSLLNETTCTFPLHNQEKPSCFSIIVKDNGNIKYGCFGFLNGDLYFCKNKLYDLLMNNHEKCCKIPQELCEIIAKYVGENGINFNKSKRITTYQY
jgi:hypothetical protein